MYWIISYVLSLAFIIFLLVRWRLKDDRYLKKSVKDTMSAELREEIRKEKEAFIARQEKFLQTLEKKKKNIQ